MCISNLPGFVQTPGKLQAVVVMTKAPKRYK